MARKRLDQILIDEGIISEEAIGEALLRQRAHGGRFGSQLLYHRYLTEAQLVRALSIQLGCPGVVISDKEIPESVVRMVPARVALARKVMPFEHDPRTSVLKIACADPTDSSLVNELAFVTSGVTIELQAAAEIALDTVIAKYYLGRDVRLEDNLLLEIPEEATLAEKTPGKPDEAADTGKARPEILLVTDEEYAAAAVQSVLERDGYRVHLADSGDAAVKAAGEHRFGMIIINDALAAESDDLADRLRQMQPGASIRACKNLPSLMMTEVPAATYGLSVKNLELLTSLVETRSGGLGNHSSRVGEYADRLCRRLRLSDADRLAVTSAAYLHDIGANYYGADDVGDARQVIELTTRLLSSLGYPETITGMLAAAYNELPAGTGQALPIEVLGGNVLTVVDLFCQATRGTDQLSLDKFDAVKKKLRDRVGTMFLPQVVEAFVDMIQEGILNVQTDRRLTQVMILADDPVVRQTVDLRLRNEGFATVAAAAAVAEGDATAAAELFGRRRPDIIVLVSAGSAEETEKLISGLASDGVEVSQVPTFLLTPVEWIPKLTGLLRRGIEDILPLSENIDLLAGKLLKARDRAHAAAGPRSEGEADAAGARGRLADMNLVDVLQVLGPGRKTARITVRNESAPESLVIYVRDGKITRAELGSFRGAEAIYEGLGWADGFWTVDSVAAEDLPEDNVQESNEAILMEGCRLLDERLRSGHLL
jgi:DNA-binding response OmpR family regulator